MKLSVISFTTRGGRLCAELLEKLTEAGHICRGWVVGRHLDDEMEKKGVLPLDEPLETWTGEQFENRDGLIFIGAAGIAVRAIAPFVKSKVHDPAVVVLDERGRYAVSLLSGHLGEANELANETAAAVGALPVITTATDINQVFSVDVFAAKRGMALSDLGKAKMISADLLEGRPVGFFSDFPVAGQIPPGLFPGRVCGQNLWITLKNSEPAREAQGGRAPSYLRLTPPIAVLGLGCRKGVGVDDIRTAVEISLERHCLSADSIGLIATIDVKREEEGLLKYARELGKRLRFFSAGELSGLHGDFTSSEFVRETVGVDNVCERAAAAALQESGERWEMIMRKETVSGVTAALAAPEWTLKFN